MTETYSIGGVPVYVHSVVALTEFVSRYVVNVLSSRNEATCYFGTFSDNGTSVSHNNSNPVYVTGSVTFNYSFKGQPTVSTTNAFTIFVDSSGAVGIV
ncbi:hypothetical protein [Desulfitobacterium sp.]|uniref:hypothetical protein n=1 Tax=Desulfitobacterium sp. TaxID=49981 RepID=UPI002C4FC76D|nr:hypothetical protein [Desulfitobacterium sp.]HVJ50674.1 hypothetical protein [Desulfitobacterium sp.]